MQCKFTHDTLYLQRNCKQFRYTLETYISYIDYGLYLLLLCVNVDAVKASSVYCMSAKD